MTATSYDIIDPANAARYKDVVRKVLVPSLVKLEEVLIAASLREAETVQVGRTHGQHAVPIRFGFAPPPNFMPVENWRTAELLLK